MATIPTWRNINSPSFTNSAGSNAISAFDSAGNAFREYGDFLGKESEKRATSAAVEEALRTGKVGDLDPKTDISTVMSALNTQTDIEGTKTDTAGQLLTNQLSQLEIDNYADNLELDQNVTRAQTEAQRAAARASDATSALRNTQGEVAQMNLTERRNLAEAERKVNPWMTSRLEQYFAEASNGGRVEESKAQAMAQDRLDQEIISLVNSGKIGEELGMTTRQFYQTSLGQRIKTQQDQVSAELARVRAEELKLRGTEAERYQENFKNLMDGRGTDALLVTIDEDGKFNYSVADNTDTIDRNKVLGTFETMVAERRSGDSKTPINFTDDAESEVKKRVQDLASRLNRETAINIADKILDEGYTGDEFLNQFAIRAQNLAGYFSNRDNIQKVLGPKGEKESPTFAMMSALAGETVAQEELELTLGDEGYTGYDPLADPAIAAKAQADEVSKQIEDLLAATRFGLN